MGRSGKNGSEDKARNILAWLGPLYYICWKEQPAAIGDSETGIQKWTNIVYHK